MLLVPGRTGAPFCRTGETNRVIFGPHRIARVASAGQDRSISPCCSPFIMFGFGKTHEGEYMTQKEAQDKGSFLSGNEVNPQNRPVKGPLLKCVFTNICRQPTPALKPGFGMKNALLTCNHTNSPETGFGSSMGT